ncbi:stAR-related lipid transfer protein 13 isoform X11 [Canis lupus baileyi]|uniref:StAR-related lipid transfer protein 13 n=1 Tax=Canis lupus familiaris TaxID=9615 RepID=A0A8C0PGS2_CANLF|nr:stAR-related lipid transfer protein 13 isoform X12 [Canis lupus familiaris]XP_035574260.2 stAR-related lipid transfer protein 13 isoform X11 [Canis lupus dingo]XP_038290815.1 stAR-related lipid transfer protein 13 isoform X12 [Canis lupus familiaris]|eukprot:XP_022265700.1 stAR-related lipid transfer protein 13 isoform X10 [Canis lupus familiaris]
MLRQGPRTPASGCYYLNPLTPEGQDMYLRFDQTTRRSPYRMSRILARQQLVTKIQQEIEAKEACGWLRAAGFPQYAQLYEDSQFPINILAVKNDHDFLEKDLVEPLYRRLNTLNKCASMKLDVNFQRKKHFISKYAGRCAHRQGDDSDEEDLCISNKWTFQRTSRRWSRVDDLHSPFPGGDRNGSSGDIRMRNTTSSESVLTDLSEPEVCSVHSESSGGSDGRSQPGSQSAGREPLDCPDSPAMLDATLVGSGGPPSPRDALGYPLHPKNEKPPRARAKSFLKRMETLRGKGAHGRQKGPGRTGGLVISGPLLQQEPDALKAMQRVPIPIPNGDIQSLPSTAGPRGLLSPGKWSGESSQSETSSSGVSTPGLKERKCQEASKRGGMYLEDLDVLAGPAPRAAGDPNHTQEFHSQENLVVHIPKDHKPGTFPKALSIESLSPTDGSNGVNWRTGSISLGRQQGPGAREPRLMASCHRASRVSIYDNVPGSHLYASTGDLLDLEKDDLFPHLDDILHHVNGLQEVVDDWSKNVLPELQTHDALVGEPGLCPFPSPNQITLDFEGNSVSEGRTTPSDVERDGTSLNESEATGVRERRDSGVGASLTRPNRRLRWNSFQLSHQPQPSTAPHISNQTAGQLNLLQRFSLLRLTAIMEKYSMSNKHGWTWSVPKFMKRMKVPDYKDKTVFGVPLIVHVQRTGQPLPQSIQQALRYLRSNCLDQVGLFRKSGVKSRIHALRQMNENFPENVSYEDQSAYDVADMVKQFFRDLPEPLFTNKLSETFLHIYQYVPKEQRLQAVQAAILLLADESREVLQTLLCFLNDVVNLVEENQMTPMNLAVCLAPSLFHLNLLKKESSPRVIQKKYATGKPDQKDLSENLAAAQGLAHMITECNRLFEVGDGHPLKLWKASVEVEAPPSVVLNRVLRERHLWDEDFVQWKVVETLDKHTEIYQYVLNSMAPHPSRDFVVLRTWKTDLPKGMCTLVSLSVEHEEAQLMGGVRAVVMDSQYLIEPCGSGKSRLTHICRIDLKGHSPEWYSKGFGHLCAAEVARIRNSFQPLIAEGPETKI